VRRAAPAALAAALVAAGAGCSVPIGTLRTVAADATPGRVLSALGHAQGRSCRWWVLGVPLGLPKIDEAVRAAVAARGGAALRDARVSSDHPLWFFVGQHCYTVSGEVLG
jgi:hypothetical protein